MKPRIKRQRELAKPAKSLHPSNKWRDHELFRPEYVPIDSAEIAFSQGTTSRPHSRRGTSTDPEDFRRAFVCAAPGSGAEKFRDTRHPDLKRKFRGATTAGLPNNVRKKHGFTLSEL
jgi:hypothetical protein